MNLRSPTQTKQPLSFTPVSNGLLQRKCNSCDQHTIAGGEYTNCQPKSGLQRKLSIWASNDPLELEADRVADRVMVASPNSVVSSAPPRIQRFTGQTTGQADMMAPASVDTVLSSPGRPLETSLQDDMGQRFGHDFSHVRVHTDAAADRSAQDVNANAYTVGHNIVFGEGQFLPGTHSGRRLLVHELTHVVQQHGAEANTTENLLVPHLPRASSTILARQIIRENPYRPSAAVPDLGEDAVKKAEIAIRDLKFQESIDILIAEAVSINRVNPDLLENKTMTFNPKLNQEGRTTDPLRDRTGNAMPTKVEIGPPAFKFGVPWLYSTIVHEFTHVQQGQSLKANMPVIVKDVSSDPGQSNAKEVEAYAFEITHAAATGLKKSPNLIIDIWGRLCHAFAYMMPIRKRSVEPIARRAFDVAESIVGADKLNNCLK